MKPRFRADVTERCVTAKGVDFWKSLDKEAADNLNHTSLAINK